MLQYYGVQFSGDNYISSDHQVEGADAVMVQELLVGGHLYLQVLKERLQQLISVVRIQVLRKAKTTKKLVIGAVSAF